MRGKSRKAIALEYGDNPVPVLTAKGDGEMAQAIIEEAERLGIQIAQATDLVALLIVLELDEEIPESLYVAVSVILSWVYWLKGISPSS